MANKNSTYVAALVSFLNDTKPYSRKLTEVIEEYRFSDSMTVNMTEALNSTLLTKSAWTYEYYSGGTATSNPSVWAHRLVMPEFRDLNVNTSPLNLGGFKVGRDEISDISLVPNVYDPKSGTTFGFSDAFIQRASNNTMLPLLEAHDVHLSHGAFTFQIKRTSSDQAEILGRFSETYTVADTFPLTVTLEFSASEMIITGPATQASSNSITVTGPGIVSVIGYSDAADYSPLFTDQAKANMMAQATSTMQLNALDETNPLSLISQIRGMMAIVQAALDNLPTPSATCDAALADVIAVLDSSNLPTDYETLMVALEDAGVSCPAPYVAWRGQDTTDPYTDRYFEQDLAALSPSLYFNSYTDMALRETGELMYESVTDRSDVVISGITADHTRADYEEFTVTLNASSFLVTGSTSGIIGVGTYNTTFTSSQVSLLVTLIDASLIIPGDVITLTPSAKITIHRSAPLETWSLIKVNPKAFSRPVLNSTRYGYIKNQAGDVGFVTILDQGVSSGTLCLTATSASTFSVTLSSTPTYSGVATVGVPFNDGTFAFTIYSGSVYSFEVGDSFFIEIVNDLPKYIDFGLVYGYDADPYDAYNLVYNNVSSAIQDYLVQLGFGYDSRFSSFDEASFDLSLSPSVTSGRQWVMRAIPDLSRPLNLQNSTPSNILNLLGTDDPTNPNAAANFDLTSHMRIWYASSFTLEYSDDNGQTWHQVATVPVGSSYSNATYGISFNLIAPAKPYIAVTMTDPADNSDFSGGDILTWGVLNNPPEQVDAASLSSVNVPRLVMFADSYHQAVQAKWFLTATGENEYTLQGYDSTNGLPIYGTTKTFSVANDGRYFQDKYLHYGLKLGKFGIDVGDVITFSTYSTAPAVLVHGTVTGFTAPAYFGKWYWNGKIGFKLAQPTVELFVNGTIVEDWTSFSVGTIALDYIRADHETAVYTIKSHVNGYWTLYRNSDAVAGGESTLDNGYIGFTMPSAVAGTSITVLVTGTDVDFTFGQDAAIVLTDAGRAPLSGDFIQLERAVPDKFDVSITPQNSAQAATLSVLAPHTTDVNVVDHSTLSGVPLVNTSPETGVLQGWFQTLLEPNVVGTTPAYFSETGVNVVVRAAATGETVGTLSSNGTNPAEDVYFTWDNDFHTKYLPLNTETLLVTRSGGMNENMRVSLTEVLTTWISGGALSDSSLFVDTASVGFEDGSNISITTTNNDSLSATFNDAFTEFLPGYDNLPYDAEVDSGTGFYGVGAPFTAWFERARMLYALGSAATPEQVNELQTLLAHLSAFLVNEGIGQTTLEDFLAALAADTSPTTGEFGVPKQGLGISVDEKPEGTAETGVIDAVTIFITDTGQLLDVNNLDVGALDSPPDTIAVVMASGSIPSDTALPTGTYEDFDSTLVVPAPGAHTIKVEFTTNQPAPTNVYVWRASASAPTPVIFTFENNRTITFTMANLEECKIIVM